MSVKISELPSLETLADNDILAGVDTSEDTTSKITLEKIKNYTTEDVYDKEEVDNTIDALQTQIDSLSTIYNAFPTASDEGESMTLEDTAEVTFKKLDLKGNTYQYSTKGKNLFSTNTATTNQNGITCKNNGDGTYTLNGTATSSVSIDFFSSETIPSGTYKVVGCPSGGSTTTYYLATRYDGVWGNKDTGNGTTITFTSFGKLSLSIASGVHFTNAILKPMITSDTSLTYNDFEQYTGGIPSPNPNYPQPVNVVSGDNTIDICGKNLANCNGMVNTTNNGITFTINKDTNNNVSSITINGTATNYNALCVGTSYRLPAGTYNLYGNGITDNIILQVLNEALTQQLGYVGKNDRQLVLNADTTIILRIMVNANATISNVEYKPMIAKTSGLTYEPYIGHSYPIYLGVENLFNQGNYVTGTMNDRTLTNNNGKLTINGTSTLPSNFELSINITPTEDMTISISQLGGTFSGGDVQFLFIPTSGTAIESKIGTPAKLTNGVTYTTARISVRQNVVCTNLEIGLQLEKGSKANSYSAYGTTPIELCKIGNYQDYIYKDNGSWYLHKEIGKVVLNGSESWVKHGSIASWFYYDGITNGYVLDNTQVLIKTNYYTPKAYQGVPNLVKGECSYGSSDSGITHRFVIKNTDYTQTNDFKNWLSTHNTIVYYVLTTPTNTLIEDTTLIEQLDTLKNATSYEGQTNISQENNDKPFILDVEAIKKLT